MNESFIEYVDKIEYKERKISRCMVRITNSLHMDRNTSKETISKALSIILNCQIPDSNTTREKLFTLFTVNCLDKFKKGTIDWGEGAPNYVNMSHHLHDTKKFKSINKVKKARKVKEDKIVTDEVIVEPPDIRKIYASHKKDVWETPDDFYKSAKWKRIKTVIYKKYPKKCMKCGCANGDIGEDDIKRFMCVDHIKPVSKYPSLVLVEDNLQVLCNVCNKEKYNIDETDYRQKIDKS